MRFRQMIERAMQQLLPQPTPPATREVFVPTIAAKWIPVTHMAVMNALKELEEGIVHDEAQQNFAQLEFEQQCHAAGEILSQIRWPREWSNP